jgi:hypothetical protein
MEYSLTAYVSVAPSSSKKAFQVLTKFKLPEDVFYA